MRDPKHAFRVAIIGGGPAGLIAAHHLGDTCQVQLFERDRILGRKFLVAGDGGLNITNSAVGEDLIAHFSPIDRMRPMLEAFGPGALRGWLASMGIPTFVGSSGRVFPQRGIKPAEVLKAIIDAVKAKGVVIHTGHRFVGFDETVRPVIAADIIDADDWEIEQPWPPMRTSDTMASSPFEGSSSCRKTTISSPQRGLNPSTRAAGGLGSTPRFRGLR